MKKSLAILMFLVAATFLCGNALALDTYIPHITTGANDWTDYLQVNNNAASTATFTLTLYGSTGAQIYSQSHSIGGRSRSQIELKALNSSAATGKITYTETGLVFRVSYNSMGGGVAEFKTIDTLGSNIGFCFSDFTTLVQWKGAAIANMGTISANVTFYALGGSSQGSGGSILESHTETIVPKTKLVGNNFNWSWLNGLNLSQIESIIAVAGSSSLCGIAISGDTALSRLLFTPATPVSNFNPPATETLNIAGYWIVSVTPQGQTTASDFAYIQILQSGGNISVSEPCWNATSIGTGTITGEIISIQYEGEIHTGIVNGDSMSGSYTSGSENGTWTATKLSTAPTDKQCVVSTVWAGCTYFPDNGQYWVQSFFYDPNAVVASATLTGDNIVTPVAYKYNLYDNKPKEWWTDPNVYISTGTQPSFPLHYTCKINFKDGTSQNVARDVRGWETAH